MESISKSFGAVTALDNVTLNARPGSVHALCGENGAGKSTLMKVLAGLYPPDSGRIFIDGSEKIFRNPGEALDVGISMLYQELSMAEHLTVYENIFLGDEIRSRVPFVIDRKAMIERTDALCEQYGFSLDATSTIKSLTTGQCQIAELLKALMKEARIIVMDEPTSSLSETESARLFEIVKDLRDRGLTIIYISHRMEEVVDLADEISVLRDGKLVATGPASRMNIATVVRHMVGRELKDFYPAREVETGEVCLQVRDLSSSEGVEGVSFDVRKGEIVGMAGLVGAGRTQVARAIFGVTPLTGGEVIIGKKAVKINSPSDAIKAGIALLTEDRKRTGLCTNLACSWNMTLPNYAGIGMKLLLSLSREKKLCSYYADKVSVKWAGPDTPVSSLSGGNQQKILIARWLMADSGILIFDEPTKGIDVGAKKEVYTLLNELAGQGKAIIMISSELPELFGVCDRMIIMRRGRLVGDIETGKASPEEVMHIAAVEEK